MLNEAGGNQWMDSRKTRYQVKMCWRIESNLLNANEHYISDHRNLTFFNLLKPGHQVWFKISNFSVI